jgi:hypothetical protein
MDHWYRVLGLAPGASEAEVKQAYRDLARVWHPDRFGTDPRLAAKAAEKLKEINRAYEALTDPAAAARERRSRAPEPDPDPTPPGAGPARRRPAPPRATEPAPPVRESTRIGMLQIAAALTLAVIMLMAAPNASALGPRAIVLAARQLLESVQGLLTRVVPVRQPAGTPTAAASDPAVGAQPPAAARAAREIVAPAPRPADTPSAPAELTTVYTAPADDAAAPAAAPPDAAPSADAALFTMGSTERSVRRAQGGPDAIEGDLWRYGSSTVQFARGKVIGYANAGNLRVKLLPAEGRYPGTFGLGSTRDHVLALQGTPTAASVNVWHYGASTVTFGAGIVTSYSNAGGNLRVTSEWRPTPRR